MDPLVWWRHHAAQFPNISKLAKKYLAIPASTASSERVFSVVKYLITKKRNRLLPERVERFVMGKCNAHFLA